MVIEDGPWAIDDGLGCNLKVDVVVGDSHNSSIPHFLHFQMRTSCPRWPIHSKSCGGHGDSNVIATSVHCMMLEPKRDVRKPSTFPRLLAAYPALIDRNTLVSKRDDIPSVKVHHLCPLPNGLPSTS